MLPVIYLLIFAHVLEARGTFERRKGQYMPLEARIQRSYSPTHMELKSVESARAEDIQSTHQRREGSLCVGESGFRDVDLSRFRDILDSRLQKKRALNEDTVELLEWNDEPSDTQAVDKSREEGFVPAQAETQSGKKNRELVWIVPPDPSSGAHTLADEPVHTDRETRDAFNDFDKYTDARGQFYRPRSRSPFTKPGLWEPNPDNPHNRDHPNKYWYHPDSVGVDWLNGQLQWGKHWAVPAVGTGGTDGMSTLHFPSIGQFFNIPDDYD